MYRQKDRELQKEKVTVSLAEHLCQKIIFYVLLTRQSTLPALYCRLYIFSNQSFCNFFTFANSIDICKSKSKVLKKICCYLGGRILFFGAEKIFQLHRR